MRRVYILLAFFVMVFSLVGLHFSFKVYQYSNNIFSAYVSNTGNLNLTIESAPSASCGDSICNGAETCSSCSSDCGACVVAGAGSSGGGTGAGGVSPSKPRFSVNKEAFNLQIVSGESETNEIIIENTGTQPLSIKISVTGIGKYISFNTDTVSLISGEKFPLTFTTRAPEPGVYAGKVILTYQGVTREILVLLNVVSEGVLFDVTVTVPDLYRVLGPGQRLPTLIELTEVGAETGVDVTMDYVIKDFDGNTHYTESETFYVLGTKSFSKAFSTAGLEIGDYVLGVELKYPGGFATSSAHFKISESVVSPQTWIAFGALLVAVIAIMISVIFYKRRKTQQEAFKKIGGKRNI